jgi:hypothetical protein
MLCIYHGFVMLWTPLIWSLIFFLPRRPPLPIFINTNHSRLGRHDSSQNQRVREVTSNPAQAPLALWYAVQAPRNQAPHNKAGRFDEPRAS